MNCPLSPLMCSRKAIGLEGLDHPMEDKSHAHSRNKKADNTRRGVDPLGANPQCKIGNNGASLAGYAAWRDRGHLAVEPAILRDKLMKTGEAVARYRVFDAACGVSRPAEVLRVAASGSASCDRSRQRSIRLAKARRC